MWFHWNKSLKYNKRFQRSELYRLLTRSIDLNQSKRTPTYSQKYRKNDRKECFEYFLCCILLCCIFLCCICLCCIYMRYIIFVVLLDCCINVFLLLYIFVMYLFLLCFPVLFLLVLHLLCILWNCISSTCS